MSEGEGLPLSAIIAFYMTKLCTIAYRFIHHLACLSHLFSPEYQPVDGNLCMEMENEFVDT